MAAEKALVTFNKAAIESCIFLFSPKEIPSLVSRASANLNNLIKNPKT